MLVLESPLNNRQRMSFIHSWFQTGKFFSVVALNLCAFPLDLGKIREEKSWIQTEHSTDVTCAGRSHIVLSQLEKNLVVITNTLIIC